MSTKVFSNTLRIAIAAAALYAPAAEAKPNRIVIQDFDGPRKLADSGHAAVVAVLGSEYDVVATKRWDQARADAARSTHGPKVWLKAARASGVDAIIEGFINDEGRKHMLTIVVREAQTGNEVDQVSIRLPDGGPTAETSKQLDTSLNAVLDWIEPQFVGGNHRLDQASPSKPMIGAKAEQGEARVKGYDSDSDSDTTTTTTKRRHRDDDDATDDAPVKKSRARKHDAATDDDDATPPPRKRHKVSVLDDDTTAPVDKKIVVGAVEPAEDKSGRKVLVDLFPPPQEVVVDGLDLKPLHRPQPTPRFLFLAGLYHESRQLEFTSGDQTGPMEYNGTGLTGLQVSAEIYPWPTQKIDGRPSGIGFSAKFSKAVGAVYTFDDGDTTADYTIDQSLFEAGVHYRWPLGQVSIDTHASYGRSTHIINDAPEELEVPDVSYEWLGVGADVELAITEHSSVSFGGSYMYMLDTGDITSEDWYGSGKATGLELHGSFVIPLPQSLFLKGSLTYRRVSTSFNGDGTLTQLWGVVDATDTSVGGAVDIGVRF